MATADDIDRGSEAAAVQVCVLGPVGLRTVGGAQVERGGRLQRLLAGLCVSPGSVVSVDRLIEIVWPTDPPEGADTAVRTYVSRLRKSLGDGHRIVYRAPGYVLEVPASDLDSAAFDEELDRALILLRSADGDEAVRLLDGAIARWRGPAYAGFAEEEWARPEAVRLEQRLVEAREALIEARLASGRPEDAATLAQSLVDSEPLRDRPRALLMRALYASGRQAEALRAYREYRRYLADETGLDPSDELAELEARIARNDPSLFGSIRPLRGYELGERIGEGSYSVVHRAVQPGVERDVAIKIIRPELADRPDFIRRFELEARTVARVEHPNVVPIFDFWREPGAAYLVMRLFEGGSVAEALRRRGPYDRDALLRLLDDVGGALASAHRAGIVHRDVRPANLLLDNDGTTYLADFGIALPVASVDDLPIMSAAHAAPEVLRGEPAGVAADVFSLGVTAFELLAGRTPFADSVDRSALVSRQLAESLPSLRGLAPEFSSGVDDVLARATAKASAERHATVASFVDDLRSALYGTRPADQPVRRADVTWAGEADNPYVGLHRFDEEDAGRFFGRERLVAEIVEALEQRALVVVVGPSGSGKSSVVRAGVLPEIRGAAIAGSDNWFVATMMPGSDPVLALEAALLRVAVNPPPSLREQLQEPGGMARAIRRVLPDDESELLLVVDQFEELFTQVDDVEQRNRFMAELAAAVTEPRSPLRVVATMRADHYDAPLQDPHLAELVTRGTVTVRPMSPADLERAIRLPASAVGVEVEGVLVTELVAGIGASPAALPLLQFSLTELFQRRAGDTMLLSTHHELGGLTGALAARADRILDSGQPGDEAETRRIFGRLAAVDETNDDRRRRALRSEFGDGGRTAVVLDEFIEARLLTADRDPATREATVEVAHEALLRSWPRLAGWLRDDRELRRSVDAIGRAATAWDRGGRQVSDLYRGHRLEAGIDIATSVDDRLLPLDLEFLSASRDQAEAEGRAERRRVRRLRRLVVGTAVALVAALVAGGLALVQQRSADRQRAVAVLSAREADGARDEAEAQRLAAEQEAGRAEEATADAELAELVARSAAAAVDRPEQAVLLALEAHQRAPGTVALRGVLDTLVGGRIGNQVGAFAALPATDCGAVAPPTRISSDGWSEFGVVDGELSRLDLRTGEVTTYGPAPEACTTWWRDDADGRRWAASSDFADHWVGRDGEDWRPIERWRFEPPGGALVPEMIDDRFLFAQNGVDRAFGEVLVVDASTLRTVAPAVPALDWVGFEFPAAAASAAAGLFAVAGTAADADTPRGLVVLLDAASGEERRRLSHPSAVTSLAFSDDGRTLVVGGSAGTVATIDVESGEALAEFAMTETRSVIAAGVRAPDGAIVAVGTRSIQVFDPDGEPTGGPIDITPSGLARVRSDGTVVIRPEIGLETIQVIDPDGGPLVEQGYDVGASGPVGIGDGRAATVDERGAVDIVDLESGDRTSVDLVLDDGTRFDAIAVTPERDGHLAWDDGRNLVRWRDGAVVDQAELWTSQIPVSLVRGSVSSQTSQVVNNAAALSDAPDLGDIGVVGAVTTGGFVGTGAALVFEDAGPQGVFSFDPDATVLDAVELPITPPFSTTAAARADDGGSYLALSDGSLRRYDRSGERTADFEVGLRDPVVAIVDPDTGVLALGGADGAVVVDPSTETARPVRDVGSVISLGFARDGTLLVIVDADGNVRLWDAELEELVGTLWAGSGTAPSSPPWYDEMTDSVWVATSGKVLRFSLDPDRWIERVCGLVTRDLTADEWNRLVPGDEPRRPACR